MWVIDNIEIDNSYKLSSENGIELRNTMADCAQRIPQNATGNDDISVYISSHYKLLI